MIGAYTVKFFIFLLIRVAYPYMNLLIINLWFYIETDFFSIFIIDATTSLIFQIIYALILIVTD